jgi:hypothetical protein
MTSPPPRRLKGGVKFADLLWPGRVLIEMKSRGEKLEKHYDQLFYYWSHIVPKRVIFRQAGVRIPRIAPSPASPGAVPV